MRLALIAHDGKKSDMVAFVMKRLKFFNNKVESIPDLASFKSEKKKNQKIKMLT